MSGWNWQTMNGRPEYGKCKDCSAKENWGVAKWDDDDESMGDEEEYKMMRVCVTFSNLSR